MNVHGKWAYPRGNQIPDSRTKAGDDSFVRRTCVKICGKMLKVFHDFLASFSDCDAAPCCQLAVSTIGGRQAVSRQPRCHHFHTHQLPHLHLCPPTPHSALRSSTRLRLRVEPPMASGVSRNPWENEHKCARIPLSSTCFPSATM